VKHWRFFLNPAPDSNEVRKNDFSNTTLWAVAFDLLEAEGTRGIAERPFGAASSDRIVPTRDFSTLLRRAQLEAAAHTGDGTAWLSGSILPSVGKAAPETE
jgi:hypothetical protein